MRDRSFSFFANFQSDVVKSVSFDLRLVVSFAKQDRNNRAEDLSSRAKRGLHCRQNDSWITFQAENSA